MKTSRGVIAKGIADLAAKAGGLITLAIFARYAGADGYGAYSQVQAIVGFVIPFATLGLGGSMVRFFSTRSWSRGVRTGFIKVVTVAALTGGVTTILMVAGAGWMNHLFLGWEQGAALFRWGAPLVVLGAIEQLLLDLLRARQRFVSLALLQVAQTGLLIAAVFWLLSTGSSLVEVLKALGLIKLGSVSVVLLSLWSWDRPLDISAGEVFGSVPSMIRFGFPLVLAGLGLWMMHLGDRLVIGHFLTPKALGLYGAVYTFSLLIVQINAPLNLPLYPRLMRAVASGRHKEVAREVRTFHRYAVLILVPGAVFLVVMMQPLLQLMGGAAFRADVFLIGMIVVSMFLQQWNATAHYILLCVDQTVFTQNVWLIAGCVNVISNLIAVPAFGLHGAAGVTLVTFLGLDAAIFLKARAFVPLENLYRFDVTWKALVSALIAGGIVIGMGTAVPSVPGIAVATVTYGMTYLFCCGVVFREIGKADLEVLARAVAIKR